MTRTISIEKRRMTADQISKKFYVFDTETTSLSPMPKNFVFGCIVGHNYRKVLYSVEEFKQEFKHKRYQNKYIFAHNAEFDLLTIYSNIFKHLDKAAVFNGKFIFCKNPDNEKLTFVDSFNIFSTSVERIGKLYGFHKLDNEKVRTNKLDKNNITDADIQYCMRDCEIVYKALLRIFTEIGTVKITLPALALYSFRLNYLNKDIKFDMELSNMFFESYYGGRTEAFRIGEVDARVYDINSLYPYAMKTTVFPDVEHLYKEDSPTLERFMQDLYVYEGYAVVEVEHEDVYIGTLPMKYEVNNTTKLIFPVGTFKTAVNFNELRFALSTGWVKVKSVLNYVYGAPVPTPFAGYVTNMYSKRMSSTDELNRMIYKLLLNSLYGRFGMRQKSQSIYCDHFPVDEIQELVSKGHQYEIKIFNPQRSDCWLITPSEDDGETLMSLPVWSSYITSAARIILLKALIANKDNGLCYCDTDSLFLEKPFKGKISEELGDFKLEGKRITKISGLKNYHYINEAGEPCEAIKGVSKRSLKMYDTEGGSYYKTRKYYKTLEALRRNKEAGDIYEMTKFLRHTYDKRVVITLHASSCHETRPLKLEKI